MDQLGRREVEGVFSLPGAAVGLGEAGPQRQDPIGPLALVVDELGAPEAGHAEDQRVVVRQGPLAHQGVGDGEVQVLGERAQFGHGVGQHDPAADVEERSPGLQERLDDPLGGALVEARLGDLPLVGQHALEQGRVDLLGENVHGHVDQHRPGAPALGENEGLLEDLREQMGRVHAPGALDERPVDFHLGSIRVQVDLLVRVLPEIVGRHVAGDHHHGNGVQRSVGHARGGVGQAGAQVRQQHRRLAGRPRVAVGGMGGDLLMPGVDELDLLALGKGRPALRCWCARTGRTRVPRHALQGNEPTGWK